jgi:carbonic anhydrase/acetyltransferase-like protein (isoleucine patch superfamily)
MLIKYRDFEPRLGARVWVADSADVIGDVELGDDAAVWFGAVVRGDVNSIRVGARTNIQDGAVIHVTHYNLPDKSDGFTTDIAEDVTIGHRAVLHGCRIGKACIIGMNSVILDGAAIGEESIVGAGALVTMGKTFPPRSLIMGSPARVARSLSDDEVAGLYESAKLYVRLKDEYR